MNYSLIDHNRGYQITNQDLLFSLMTGLSGVPYASRHYEMAKVENAPKWGHRLVCLIEFLPILGGLTALFERVVYALFGSGYSPVSWREKSLTVEAAAKNMHGNSISLIAERYLQDPVYASLEEGLPKLEELAVKPKTSLHLNHEVATAQGPRPQMEDAHFYKEMAEGTLAGVFDGHGGKEVSTYAAEEFEKRFPKALKEAKGNVHHAFETLLHHIHQEIVRHPEWNGIGSTAVVCYIDHKTHQIYTATLGDSEANIYRRSGWWGNVKSIPLSIIKDWIKDKDRLVKAFGLERFTERSEQVKNNPKGIRSHLSTGVNVSRALGDVDETGSPSSPLVIHKPKITVNQLRSGDVVVLACDGLKDFVPEKEIAGIVQQTASRVNALSRRVFGKKEEATLPQALVQKALENMSPLKGDNVTVLSIQVA